jgi:hypothetical protein
VKNTQQSQPIFNPVIPTFFGLAILGAIPFLYTLYVKSPENFDSNQIINYIFEGLIFVAYIYIYCIVVAILMTANLILGVMNMKRATSINHRYISYLTVLLAVAMLFADAAFFKYMTSSS